STNAGCCVACCLSACRAPVSRRPRLRSSMRGITPARGGGGHERFLAAERQLVRGFDEVCGDTFCEGQYINLWAMRLRCSVEQVAGVVVQCVWTFAGSDTRVKPSGLIKVNRGRYACVLPLAAGTRLETLLQVWETGDGFDALHAPLPGTTANTYDALVDCL
ncbi:hypothetical protein, partial [Stenotrophomonas maltophilia]|uniref:hypothetical protein n=2 Tax=Stenotrophomonas maltophilia TaxID=40324 RepID=UPI001F53469D